MSRAPAVEKSERDAPPPGRWDIDPVHSAIGFSVRHMMVAKVRGRFARVEGTAVVERPLKRSSVHAVIQASSIDTANADRDEHLRSQDFLDVARHPTIEFRSTRISRDDDGWVVHGELSIAGVTQTVALDVEYLGHGIMGEGEILGFSARAEFDREDFGLTWNQVLETGGFAVGRKIAVELDMELCRRS